MKTRLKTLFLGLSFIFFIAAPLVSVTLPQSVSAIECEQRLLGIPPWFRGMTEARTVNGIEQCFVKTPESFNTATAPDNNGLSNFIWRIALNVIEIGLVIVGYIAFFFILYGGFQFLTGGSNPGQLEKAKKTILNAVIGLAISFGSIAITNLIFGLLG